MSESHGSHERQTDGQADKAQATHLPHTGNIHALICSRVEVDDLE